MPLELNSLNLGDCLELMHEIPDRSIDMVLADLPYAVTQNFWDTPIDVQLLWEQYWRVVKTGAPIVLTAVQPFSSILVTSAISKFRYEWTWDKVLKSGHLNAKRMPMRQTESILVFSNGSAPYNPIMTNGKPQHSEGSRPNTFSSNYGAQTRDYEDRAGNTEKYPSDLLVIPKLHSSITLHSTQKTPELFEYLIRTYTNKGDVVLDNTAGVYTTAVAAINTNRQYICIEKDPGYHALGKEWVRLVKDGMQWKDALKQVKKNRNAILDEATSNS